MRQREDPQEVIYIGGEAVDGEFTITFDNRLEPFDGDEIKPAELITGGSFECFTTVDMATYERFVAPTGEASMQMIRGGPRATEPRCLWGRRRGYVQVGSKRDIYGDYTQIDIPRVQFRTAHA